MSGAPDSFHYLLKSLRLEDVPETKKAPFREEGGRSDVIASARVSYGTQAVTATSSRNQPSPVTEQSVIEVKPMRTD